MPLVRKPAEAASDIRRQKNTLKAVYIKAVYIRSESSLYILAAPQLSDYPRITFIKMLSDGKKAYFGLNSPHLTYRQTNKALIIRRMQYN